MTAADYYRVGDSVAWWPAENQRPQIMWDKPADRRAWLRSATGLRRPPYSDSLWREIVSLLPDVTGGDVSAQQIMETLDIMRRSGVFYAHERPGLRFTTLWRLSECGMAPVTPAYLRKWHAQYVSSDVSPELIAAVLHSELSGFTVVTDETAALV
jgi:hypothetical protein